MSKEIDLLIETFRKTDEQKTYVNLAKFLNKIGCKSPRGKSWTSDNINRYCYSNDIELN